jgi:hypothetical protein
VRFQEQTRPAVSHAQIGCTNFGSTPEFLRHHDMAAGSPTLVPRRASAGRQPGVSLRSTISRRAGVVPCRTKSAHRIDAVQESTTACPQLGRQRNHSTGLTTVSPPNPV